MKKTILLLVLLTFFKCNAQSFFYYTLQNKSSDSTTSGSSFYVDLLLVNTIGADASDSIKMMVYSNFAETFVLSTPIKTTFGGFGSGNADGTSIRSTNNVRFTFNMPNHVGWVYLFSNKGFGPIFLDSVYLSSAFPDFQILNFPTSAFPGDSLHFNIKKGTYKYTFLDSLKIKISNITQRTIAVKDIINNTIGIKVNAPAGMSQLYFSGVYGYSCAISINSVTSIIEPFDSAKPRTNINYYDLLGRLTTPKDGDLIRYTDFGAIVY